MNLYDEFFAIAQQFHKNNIHYAVVGGIAMAFHDQPRFTRDIDFLVLPDAVDKVHVALEAIGYFQSSDPWTFRSTNLTLHRFVKTEEGDYVVVDVLTGPAERYKNIIDRAAAQDWAEGTVRVVHKDDLVWMKRQRNSDQDQVDIQRLQDDKNREGDERAK